MKTYQKRSTKRKDTAHNHTVGHSNCQVIYELNPDTGIPKKIFIDMQPTTTQPDHIDINSGVEYDQNGGTGLWSGHQGQSHVMLEKVGILTTNSKSRPSRKVVKGKEEVDEHLSKVITVIEKCINKVNLNNASTKLIRRLSAVLAEKTKLVIPYHAIRDKQSRGGHLGNMRRRASRSNEKK